MRLWLQNILACPICKTHPLKLIVFEWDKPDNTSETEALKKMLINDVEKKIISPKSMISLTVIASDELLNRRIEKLKHAFTGLNLDYDPNVLMAKIESEMEFFVETIYRLNIKNGLLICVNCKRWFPIGSSIDGVPEMLPDDLRDKIKDKKFINLWFSKLPEDLKKIIV
ncbi:MAG: Trm112 family protein [Candidatus Odinarchaeota archaeon]